MGPDLASRRPHGFDGGRSSAVPSLEEAVAILVPIRLPDQFGFGPLRLNLFFGYVRLISHSSEYVPLEFNGPEAEAAERQLRPYSSPTDQYGRPVTGVVK